MIYDDERLYAARVGLISDTVPLGYLLCIFDGRELDLAAVGISSDGFFAGYVWEQAVKLYVVLFLVAR